MKRFIVYYNKLYYSEQLFKMIMNSICTNFGSNFNVKKLSLITNKM